jgi:hypothetical protein
MADLDFTTRGMYQGYIERTIRPALGDYEVGFLEQHPELLDRLYAKLRHRRRLCGGRVLAAASCARSAGPTSTRTKATKTSRRRRVVPSRQALDPASGPSKRPVTLGKRKRPCTTD